MGTEALIAQGFPIHPVIHKGLQLSCFSLEPESSSHHRTARTMRMQAGNSMQTFAIAVQFLFMMLHVDVAAPDCTDYSTLTDYRLQITLIQIQESLSLSPFSLESSVLSSLES